MNINKEKKLKIFISSPIKGLEEERAALIKALEEKYKPEAMELWVSSPEHPKNICLERVRNSDAVILISGPYYGSIDSITGDSYTELEYDEADAYRINVFHFYKVKSKGVAFASEEKNEERRKKHQAFFNKIWQSKFSGPGFESTDELVAQALAALEEHVKQKREKLHPFVQADIYYKDFLKKGHFRHDYELVGRDKTLNDLNEFIQSDKRVFVLFGRGGLGKSKILYEFANRLKDNKKSKWNQVSFLRETFDINEATLKEWPTGNSIIVLDDAHRYDDLETLISIFKGNPAADKIKLIFSARPLGKDKINYALSRNIAYDNVITSDLEDLDEKDIKILAHNILNTKDRRTIEIVTSMTKDCPLATIVACNLINENYFDPNTITHKDDFQRIIFDRFLEDFKGKDYNDTTTQRILDYISILSPVMPSDINFREKLNKILNLPVSDIVKRIDALEKKGLLSRKGRFVRIAPDLLSDHILYKACVSKDGNPTGFVDEVFSHFQDDYMKHILFNASEVEWRANLADKEVNLLDDIWKKIKDDFLKGTIPARIKIIDEIEKAAVFQPLHALEIIDFAINKPAIDKPAEDELMRLAKWSNDNVLEKLPRLLRQIAYNINYFEQSCDLLWGLGKTEERELNPYPESALRILLDLAEYGTRKQKAYNVKMLASIKKWLSQEDAYTHRYSPLDILIKLLAKEGKDTEFRKGAFVMGSFALNFDVIDDLRSEALTILKQHLQPDKPKHIIAKALDLLTHALSYPPGLFGRQSSEKEKKYLQKEQIKILHIIKEVIPHLKSGALKTVIKKDLIWYQLHGRSEELKEKVKDVIDTINETETFRIYRALVGNYREFLEHDHNWEKHSQLVDTETKEVANIVLQKYNSATDIFNTLNEYLIDISEYNLSTNPSFLLSQIAKENSDIALNLCRLIVENPDSELTKSFSSLIWPLRIKEDCRENINATMDIAIERQDQWTCLNIAHFYSYGTNGYTDYDYENIKKLLKIRNANITKTLIHGMAKIGQKDCAKAFELAMLVDLEQFPELSDDFCSIFDSTYGAKLDNLDDSNINAILEKLLPINIFERQHYHADKLFEYFTQRGKYLDSIVDFFIKRLEYAQKKDNKYQPLPYLDFDYAFKNVSKAADFKKHINKVLELALSDDDKGENYFWLPKLFKAISDNYSTVSLDILVEWVESSDQKKIQIVARLLREAPTSFLYDNLGFVVKLLEAANNISQECYRNVSSNMFSLVYAGGMTRTVGQPSHKHVHMKEKVSELLKNIDKSSVAYRFYSDILEHAKKELENEIISDAEIDE